MDKLTRKQVSMLVLMELCEIMSATIIVFEIVIHSPYRFKEPWNWKTTEKLPKGSSLSQWSSL